MSKHIQDQPPQLMIADFNTTVVRRFRTRESDRYKVVQAAQQSEDIADGIWPYITQEAITQERSECEMVVLITEEDAPTVIRDLSATPIISKLPYRPSTVAGPLVGYHDWMIDGNRLIGIKVIDYLLLMH
ncbi:hypothetical protein FRC12_012768 [Ceratobasidium sp. 428]|nr:hypothetical protein FRC12_012768 [Ceratobasidium sp. 428]